MQPQKLDVMTYHCCWNVRARCVNSHFLSLVSLQRSFRTVCVLYGAFSMQNDVYLNLRWNSSRQPRSKNDDRLGQSSDCCWRLFISTLLCVKNTEQCAIRCKT